MYFGVCQIIYVGMLLLSFGMSIADHGKTRVKTDNAWVSLVAICIQMVLLIGGGFFEQ